MRSLVQPAIIAALTTAASGRAQPGTSGAPAAPAGRGGAHPPSHTYTPQAAPGEFAPEGYGLAVRIPPGLAYCRIRADRPHSDHSRVLYLRAPAACDANGHANGAGAGVLPSLNFEFYSNWLHRYPDGERVGRTPAEVAQELCAAPRPLAGVTLLGRPAVGCRTVHGDRIEVVAAAPYYDARPVASGAPDVLVLVTLATTRAQLAADWPAFTALAAGVVPCAAAAAGVAGRPPCPTGAYWQ